MEFVPSYHRSSIAAERLRIVLRQNVANRPARAQARRVICLPSPTNDPLPRLRTFPSEAPPLPQDVSSDSPCVCSPSPFNSLNAVIFGPASDTARLTPATPVGDERQCREQRGDRDREHEGIRDAPCEGADPLLG